MKNNYSTEITLAPRDEFTGPYLRLCVDHRFAWGSRPTEEADFYFDLQRSALIRVSEMAAGNVVDANRFAFVPAADQLLELIADRLRAAGMSGATDLSICCERGVWRAEIRFGQSMTSSTKNESIHSALFQVVIQFSAFVSLVAHD